MSGREDMIAGRYRLISRVGTGGMGVVWEAWDERLERRVAAKQLRMPPGLGEAETELAIQRALREARTTAKLHHRHAVSVFDVVDDDGQPCLIMPFIPSVTLAALLQEGGALQTHEAARVGAEVASALAAAHRLGIVHRDVKPGNILIADDGSALISDFGISRTLGDPTLTSTGLVHGTPAYLAPEVARGEQSDFASDVFSLGATLYAALEGAPPFGTVANSIALLHRVAAGEFAPPQRAGELTPTLLRMLSREPSARPPMLTLAATLAGLASGDITSRSTPAPVAAEFPPAEIPPAPVTPAPVTAAPVTAAPVTAAPVTAAPVTAAPVAPAAASAGLDWSSTGEDTVVRSAPRRRRAARWAVPVVALLAVGVLAAVFGILRMAGPGAGAVVQPPGESTSATPAGSDRPSSSRSPSPEPSPAQRSTSESSGPSRSPSSAPTGRESSEANSSRETRLKAGVTRYYGLMPDNTAEGWPLMTANYKANTARSRQSYERFWADFERVTVRDMRVSPPHRVRATIVYYYKDGRVMTELTSIRLAEEDGIFKLDDHTVLNSSTQ